MAKIERRKDRVWVVEINMDGEWEATEDVLLSREEARARIQGFHKRIRNGFRVRSYSRDPEPVRPRNKPGDEFITEEE